MERMKGDIMITMRILNETGHTELTLEVSEVIEQIDSHPTHWLFVDGELVSRQNIEEINWDAVESVDLTPAIVGGCY
jgi:hypothetical protein